MAEVEEDDDLIRAIKESALEAEKTKSEMAQLQRRLHSNLDQQGMRVRAEVPGDGNWFFFLFGHRPAATRQINRKDTNSSRVKDVNS